MRDRVVGFRIGSCLVLGLVATAALAAVAGAVDIPLAGNRIRLSDATHPQGRRNIVGFLDSNVDLGNISPELGTAERMPNGNYVFNSGSQGGGTFGQSIEVWAANARSSSSRSARSASPALAR